MVCMVLSPGLGLLIDATGNRLSYATFGALLLFCSHCLELTLPECDQCDWALVPLFIQGFSYSLYVILNFSSFVAYMVEPHSLGTAYGIVVILLNVGMFLFPLMIGEI